MKLSPYKFALMHGKSSQCLYKKIKRGTVKPKRDEHGNYYFLKSDPWPVGKPGRPKEKKDGNNGL